MWGGGETPVNSEQSWGSSVPFSRSLMPDSLQPHGLEHARTHCPSPTLSVYSNSCPLSWWCRPTISSCLQSFPASKSFQWVSSLHQMAKVLEFQLQHQSFQLIFRTGWISLQSKGLPRVFSNTTLQKHQFFGAQQSLYSNSRIHTWPLEKA